MKPCSVEFTQTPEGAFEYRLCDSKGGISEGRFPASQVEEFEALLTKYKYEWKLGDL